MSFLPAALARPVFSRVFSSLSTFSPKLIHPIQKMPLDAVLDEMKQNGVLRFQTKHSVNLYFHSSHNSKTAEQVARTLLEGRLSKELCVAQLGDALVHSEDYRYYGMTMLAVSPQFFPSEYSFISCVQAIPPVKPGILPERDITQHLVHVFAGDLWKFRELKH